MRAPTLLALLASLILPAAVHAQVLHGATGAGVPSNLYRISPTTAAVSTIGPIGHGVTGMALHPYTGVMYGVTTTTPACSRCLITGLANFDAIEFGPAAGAVFAGPPAAPTLSEWAMILLALGMAWIAALRPRGRFPRT